MIKQVSMLNVPGHFHVFHKAHLFVLLFSEEASCLGQFFEEILGGAAGGGGGERHGEGGQRLEVYLAYKASSCLYKSLPAPFFSCPSCSFAE